MGTSDLRKVYLQRQIPYVKPFYSIDYENDKDVLEWIKSTDTSLAGYYQPLFREQKNDLRIFLNMGVNPNFVSPLVEVYLQQGLIEDYPQEININEIYLLVMEQVSTIVSNELTAQVLPNNDDYKDKIAAKFVKMWLDSMSYDLNIDLQRVKWEIQKKIFGEAFIIPKWNPEKGDLHPMSREIQEDRVELVDENGRKVLDENGETIWIDKWQRIGDIELKNPLPFDVMIDPKNTYDESNWFYYCDYLETEYLVRKYPDLKFKKNNSPTKFDPTTGKTKGSDEYTKVYYFYHRAHEFLREGRHVVATDDQVLVNESMKDNPTLIDNCQLPLVRFCEMDLGFGVRGTPIVFRNTLSPVIGYNALTNQIFQNLEAESPKMLVHQSSGVNAERMPNGIVAIEYMGVKPSFETPTTNTSSIFKFREDLKRNIIELGQQTPMQRGDTPNAQLDSFVALQHFEDLRVQQAAPDIKGHIRSMEMLYRLMITIAADHYDEDDGRLIKIAGRNNKVNLKFFDPENLSKVYDVKITTTGNLANSKAARTQLIMSIKREFPNMISDEVFVDMVGLSSSEKFQNAITAAVNSAEAENEDLLNGIPVPPPERFEDLLTHWDIHRIPLQTQEYKLAPPEVKMLFEKHVTATEKLMYEQMTEDPGFASRIQGLRQFPLFYSPEPTNQNPEQEEAAFENAQPLPTSVEEVDVNRGNAQIPNIPMDAIPDLEQNENAPEPAMQPGVAR